MCLAKHQGIIEKKIFESVALSLFFFLFNFLLNTFFQGEKWYRSLMIFWPCFVTLLAKYYQNTYLEIINQSLTLCLPETPKWVPRVFTVCKGKIDLQTKEHIFLILDIT